VKFERFVVKFLQFWFRYGKVSLIRNPEVFVGPGGDLKAVIYGIDTSAGRAAMEPLEKSFQFFFGTFGPDFDIPFGSVTDPAGKTPELGFMETSVTEAYALDTAPDTGEEGGRGWCGRWAGSLHRSPSS
jgi:hypothetical protein